jgi:hypothetical protein
MTTYDFQTQLRKGEAAERLLDQHFAAWFDIEPASRDEQRRGIDRWFTGKRTGQRIAVEMKTDFHAARTGNAFVETVSVDGAKQGWAFTSSAAWLLYYCPGFGGEQVYMVRFQSLRERLTQWVSRWPEKTVQNDGYFTRGVLVPLREFERAAFQVVSL